MTARRLHRGLITHPVAAVGVGFATPGRGLLDTGDGSGRLLSFQLPGGPGPTDLETEVLDGPAVLALGPGGDGDTATPITTYDAPVVLIAEMGDPTATLVMARGVNAGPIEVTVVRKGETMRFTSEPEPYFPHHIGAFDGFRLLDGPDGTFLRLAQTSRSGTGHYLWSLTDPCTALAVTAAPPPAAPAQPVEADATFTG